MGSSLHTQLWGLRDRTYGVTEKFWFSNEVFMPNRNNLEIWSANNFSIVPKTFYLTCGHRRHGRHVFCWPAKQLRQKRKITDVVICRGITFIVKDEKIPLFLDFKASKNLRNLGRKPFKKKSSKSQVYLLVLTVKTRITTRSQGTKKTESSTSFTVELQLLDDYVGQIVTILMINAS